MKEFRKIAILGGGLLGGSMALALAGRREVALWARRDASVAEARAAGITGATGDLAKALEGAELVVLCVPVGAMAGLVEQAIEVGLNEGCLITDVGSVKRVVHQELAMLRERGIPFIGGHPMAGSERCGIDASRSDLFDGATCFLTDEDGVGDPEASLLAGFWEDLNCRVSWIKAEEHDQLVARISHFPHLMAAATALVSLKNPDEAAFGGGGLRDTTRVAGGDPGMWAEIVMENREAIAASVSESIEQMKALEDALESGDQNVIHQWLERAHQWHAACQKNKESKQDPS
ncbi:MAG: prephenate dehydrogenase/arogenate dehydrogenase family protein [Verrucomicrobiota bacterium]